MCRVAGVAKVTDENRVDVWLFMMTLGEYMSNGNTDGLGYAALDKEGKIFGERWLHNATAFRDLNKITQITPEMMPKLYSFLGDKVERMDARAIILHTRMATCERGIKNTHPFVNDESNPTSVIIHNGVITNHYKFQKKYSSCDSEVIVHQYDKENVSADLKNIGKAVENLEGWFTVLGLSKDADGKPIMDIFTDGQRLNSFFVKELGTRVWSTSAQDIRSTARDFGFTLEEHWTVEPNTAYRIDVNTGDITELVKFELKPEPNEDYEDYWTKLEAAYNTRYSRR